MDKWATIAIMGIYTFIIVFGIHYYEDKLKKLEISYLKEKDNRVEFASDEITTGSIYPHAEEIRKYNRIQDVLSKGGAGIVKMDVISE